MELGSNGAYGPVVQVNSLPATAPSYPVPGVAGLFSTLVAWQQTPATAGPAEIRVRYEPRASTLGLELVLSSPAQGPTDAALGLAATGDGGGDAAVAWVQGAAGSSQIVVDQMYQPPGAASVAKKLSYSRTTQPVLRWSASSSSLGTDHIHRHPRRDPGRSDRGHLAEGPRRARERLAQLAGHCDQSGRR